MITHIAAAHLSSILDVLAIGIVRWAGFTPEATLRLLPTKEGGLELPVPSGSRVCYPTSMAPMESQIGAMIELAGREAMNPGEESSIKLHFWVDDARLIATPRATFHASQGRDVGDGRIIWLHNYEVD